MNVSVTSVALISAHAPSIIGFRGPLVREMVGRGITVYAFAPNYDLNTETEVRRLGAVPVSYNLRRGGMNPLQDVWSVFQLWNLLRQLKPDAVLSYFAKPVIYGTIAATMAGVERRYALIEGLGFVFTSTSHINSIRWRLLRYLMTNMYRLALRHAHRVFFLNHDDINEFRSLGIVREDRVLNLGGIGVLLEEWRPAEHSLYPLTFTMAARLLREKGVVEFVEAARCIKAKYPEVRFWLLGDIDYENPGAIPEHEVRSWEADGVLEWKGYVSDIADWYARTSVFVLPSYREGVPRSTQEAMAMARPVITTDVPGCRETVIDGLNGFLIPPRDPKALADAMERFIKNPDLIPQMGKESRRLAEERFDARRVNQVILREMGVLFDHSDYAFGN